MSGRTKIAGVYLIFLERESVRSVWPPENSKSLKMQQLLYFTATADQPRQLARVGIYCSIDRKQR